MTDAELFARVDALLAAHRKRLETDLLTDAAHFAHDVDLLDAILSANDAAVAAWRETLPDALRRAFV